jgi:hypothetical protein
MSRTIRIWNFLLEKFTFISQEAAGHLQKFEAEERRLYKENVLDAVNSTEAKRSSLPPPPILKSRTNTAMTLIPADFVPSSGEKVSFWASIPWFGGIAWN